MYPWEIESQTEFNLGQHPLPRVVVSAALLNALQREFKETGDNSKVELQARASGDQGVLEHHLLYELQRTYCPLQNRIKHVSYAAAKQDKPQIYI